MKTFNLVRLGLVLVSVLSAAASVQAGSDFRWTPPSAASPQALAPSLSTVGTSNIRDPQGDTFGTGAVCPIQVDIRRIECKTTVNDVTLQCEVRFFEPHVSNEVGGANVVVGYIDFDTDQNPATGTTAQTDIFGPPGTNTSLGMDYFVEFFDVSNKQASVFDASFNFVGTAHVKINSNELKVSIPLRVRPESS